MSELYPQFDIISEYQIFTYETIQNLQKEILSNYSEKNLMQTSESKEQVHIFFWILELSEESGKWKWFPPVGASAIHQTAQNRFREATDR